jgi:hypothetical protein
MDSFRDASSSETKSDMSCWNDSPSPRMKFSSPEACKASGPPEAPDVIKRRFAKKRLAKSSSPRRTSARLSKIKAEVIETKEPIVIRPQIEPDLRTISMEACFGDSVSRDSSGTRQVDLNSKLMICRIGASRNVLTRTRTGTMTRTRVSLSISRFRRVSPNQNPDSPREQQQGQPTR